MLTQIGRVEALFRYPVKSMRGESLEVATLGWHGFDGDRRLAFRRIDARSGFPWLSASSFPELVLYTPLHRSTAGDNTIPTHVRTPDGKELPLFGEELREDVESRYGKPVEMTYLRNGIFDDAFVSVIASETVNEIARRVGASLDIQRFRPNIVVRLSEPAAFAEDHWVGGKLSFGEGDPAAAMSVTTRDLRCAMVNLDPNSANSAPQIMQEIVRANDNNAGVYAAVVRAGRIAVGQPVLLSAAQSTAHAAQ